MPPKLSGQLTVTALTLTGELNLGQDWRLALADVAGRGELTGFIQAGPLKLPVKSSLSLRREGDELVIRPRKASFLWWLAPFLGSASLSGQGWSFKGGAIRLELGTATAERVAFAAAAPAPPGKPGGQNGDDGDAR